ncbi:MAG: type II and III secretion system protein family protein [Hyphomonadaceae bacterium]|nr:type II and III secretion system protein family protein [Hyphomonadaceae bacterium]
MNRSAVARGVAFALFLSPCAAMAVEAGGGEAVASRVINVPRDKSLSFELDAPARRIIVAQPQTAQIVATTDRSFYVRGKALGSTNLLIYGPGGALTQVIDVRVGYDAAALQRDLAEALPGESIKVHTLGEGLLLTGQVSTTAVAARAKAFAEKFAPDAITSALTARASQQVILEVRIIEVGRSALQEIGFNIAASGSGFDLIGGSGLIGSSPAQGLLHISGRAGSASIDVVLQALEQKGVLRTLAKPNLTALSGEKSSFLAGGEFPFPVPTGKDLVAIEFRSFGVTLNFQPTVEENGMIRLQVAPEVSQLDPRNSVEISGVTIPSLTVRRANTTVELRSGESFAIAGLFQQDYINAARSIPGMGDVPVIGALFRSSRWSRQETELVIIVTPKLAATADFAPQPPTPLNRGREPDDIDFFFSGRALDAPMQTSVSPHWPPAEPRL